MLFLGYMISITRSSPFNLNRQFFNIIILELLIKKQKILSSSRNPIFYHELWILEEFIKVTTHFDY